MGGAQETLCWGQKEGTAVLQKNAKKGKWKYEIIPSLIIQNIIPVTTPGISSQDFFLGLFFKISFIENHTFPDIFLYLNVELFIPNK